MILPILDFTILGQIAYARVRSISLTSIHGFTLQIKQNEAKSKKAWAPVVALLCEEIVDVFKW